MRNAGAGLHWEGQKRFFTLVEFAVFVGHPGWDVFLERESKDAIPGSAGVEGTGGRRAACQLADTGHAV